MQHLAIVGMVDSAVDRVEQTSAEASGKEKRASALELVRARLAGIAKVFGESLAVSDSILLGLIDTSVAYKHATGEFDEHKKTDGEEKSSYAELYPELTPARSSKGKNRRKEQEA